MRVEGLEPPHLAAQVPKTCASTNFAIPAILKLLAAENLTTVILSILELVQPSEAFGSIIISSRTSIASREASQPVSSEVTALS